MSRCSPIVPSRLYRSLERGRERCGILPRSEERTLWVHGASVEDFRAAEPVLASLSRAFPRLRVRRVTGDRTTWTWLRAHHEAGTVLAAPFEVRGLAKRFVARLRPNTIVLLGSRSGIGRHALARARRRRTAVALVDGFAPFANDAVPRSSVDRFCVRSASDEKALLETGVAPAHIEVTGALPRDASGPRDPEPPPPIPRTSAVLEALVARERSPGDVRRGDLKKRLARSSVGRRLSGLRTRRLADFDALRDELGRPHTILCLGNGPSSEDPRVLATRHDALFRVNWRWQERGILTRPDVVFTGEPDTLVRVPDAVVVFRAVREEERVLRRMLFERRPWRIRTLTYARTEGFLNDPGWTARPTNGAVMLATAVALRPARLVMAGIDLFADPAGSYPGDAHTPNAYMPVHDRDVELALIERALSDFRGEVVVIGDVLNAALRARRRLGEGGA